MGEQRESTKEDDSINTAENGYNGINRVQAASTGQWRFFVRTWTNIPFEELKAADRLPSPPGVALALLRMTGNENCSVQEFADVLSADPALAGRAIKMANSAGKRTGRAVVSAREAVIHLGTRAVSNLALGFWLVSQSRSQECKHFDYTRYWQKSLAAAAAVKALARKATAFSADEAFTCGLVSEVGHLALATIYPDAYGEILLRCERDGIELLAQLERERFATDHIEMTAAMLQDWGLPDDYADAVIAQSLGNIDLADNSRVANLARMLDLGLLIAEVCTAGEDERDRLLAELLKRGQHQAIDSQALLILADQAMAESREWGQVFQVATPEVASLAKLAERLSTAAKPALDVSLQKGRGLRILVASSHDEATTTLVATLGPMGHVVTSAASPDDIFRNVLDGFPQVIIIDGFQTSGDGHALCRHLRQTQVGNHCYILGLTATTQESQLAGMFESGIDDVLPKPVHPAELSSRLRAAVRFLGLRDEANRDKEEMRRFAVDLAVVNRRLNYAAYEDALTRLPNRRHGLERLNQEWARNNRTPHGLACAVVDVDFFKRVNDTYGHDIGDLVLQATAEVLRKTVRVSDLACRLGGEEFLILIPDADLVGATVCAERVRAKVEANKIRTPRGELAVTVSVGLAARDSAMHNAHDLLKKADTAVYAAKQAGRNCVRT